MTDAGTPPTPGTLGCPRCGAAIPPGQDWCLSCGLAARTVVAPTPAWRVPVAVLATIAALALAALAVAFVDLTADPEPPATPPAAPGAPPATAPATTEAAPPADPSQTAPTGAETVTTPGADTPVTQPGEVTIEREGEDGTVTTDQAPPAEGQP